MMALHRFKKVSCCISNISNKKHQKGKAKIIRIADLLIANTFSNNLV